MPPSIPILNYPDKHYFVSSNSHPEIVKQQTWPKHYMQTPSLGHHTMIAPRPTFSNQEICYQQIQPKVHHPKGSHKNLGGINY
jgi:hypothetical protein